MNRPADIATPEEAVGRAVRAVLEEWGLTHDDLATAAQRLGLSWGRSTVSHLCVGRKILTVQELLLLPSILAAALGPNADEAGPWLSVPALLAPPSVAALELAPATDLRPAVTLPIEALIDVLTGGPFRLEPTRSAFSEADRKAARSLGVTLEELTRLAGELWGGRSLIEERDCRLGDPELVNRFWERDKVEEKLAAERDVRAAEKAGDEDKAAEAIRSVVRAEIALQSGPPASLPAQLRASWTSGAGRFRTALRGWVTRELIEDLRNHLEAERARNAGTVRKGSTRPRKALRDGTR